MQDDKMYLQQRQLTVLCWWCLLATSSKASYQNKHGAKKLQGDLRVAGDLPQIERVSPDYFHILYSWLLLAFNSSLHFQFSFRESATERAWSGSRPFPLFAKLRPGAETLGGKL
jgi:hypothetical protein